MAHVFRDQVYCAIDVGTTKICVLIAQHIDKESFDILGIGKSPSYGLQKGVVVDVAKTISSIRAALKEAQLAAGIDVTHAAVGISGAHIRSMNSDGVVGIKRGIITEQDIQNALTAARAVPVPEGEHILHVLAQYFIIDGREKVHDPHGMHGVRLEVRAHIILGAVASVQNLVSCCEKTGVTVSDIILEQLASSEAILSADERDLGVGVLDIGGGTTDFAVYQQGSIRHTMVLPVAGNHFTNDIAIGLRATKDDAERIKHEYGYAGLESLEDNEFFEVELVHGKQRQVVQSSDLIRIIEPRALELFLLVKKEIKTYGLEQCMTTGLVLTGGGSLLNGMELLAEKVFEMPVRIGGPHESFNVPTALQSPLYATGYGLLVHSFKKYERWSRERPMVKRVVERMKSWVLDFF